MLIYIRLRVAHKPKEEGKQQRGRAEDRSADKHPMPEASKGLL